MSSTEDRPEQRTGAPQWWSHPDRPVTPPSAAADAGGPVPPHPAVPAPGDGDGGGDGPDGAPERPQWWSHPDRPATAPRSVPAPRAAGADGRDPWGTPGAADDYLADPWGEAAPEQPRRDLPRLVAVGALVLGLVAGGLGGAIGSYLEDQRTGGHITLPQISDTAVNRAPDSVAGIAGATLPGVVYIHVKGPKAEGTGTGFVLDTEGHILTNNHVIAPAASSGTITVTFNSGQSREASVIGRDGGYDLAVIRVTGVSGLRPLTLGDSDAVRVGDPVVAIGAPFGLEGTVTSGIISATHRPITAGGEGDGDSVSYVDALQTDAPINPGNSGGPLVDARGRVIGINAAIRSASGGTSDPFGTQSQAGSIGLGFAIPVNEARRVAEQLVNKGRAEHPVIGVTLDLQYNGDGAQVLAKSGRGSVPVTPGGPADRAGIQPGDVIISVDGHPVHDGDELVVFIRSHKPGDTVPVTVRRDGQELSLRVTLGAAAGS